MEMQEVEIFIEKDGQVRIEVRGVKGGDCLRLTEPLEKALGGSIVQREMTPEIHDAPATDPARQRDSDRSP
jgi:hypothetical protein